MSVRPADAWARAVSSTRRKRSMISTAFSSDVMTSSLRDIAWRSAKPSETVSS